MIAAYLCSGGLMWSWFKKVALAFIAHLAVTTCAPYNVTPLRMPKAGQPSVEVSVYISPDFTDNERKNIVKGLAMWDQTTNGLVSWHVFAYTPTPPSAINSGIGPQQRVVVFMRVTSKENWVQTFDKKNAPKRLLGMLVGDPLYVSYAYLVEDRLRSGDDEVTIAAHEFGHALGVGHVADAASIMSAIYSSGINCFTVYDLTGFCKVYGCAGSNLRKVCIHDHM